MSFRTSNVTNQPQLKHPPSRYKNQLVSSSALAGLMQSIATYPLNVLTTRGLSGSSIKASWFRGYGFELSSRVSKSVGSVLLLNEIHQVKWSDTPLIQAAASGAVTGVTEGILFTPFTNLKNKCQVSEESSLQVLRKFKYNQLMIGSEITAIRNAIFSFIALGIFANTSSPNDAKYQQAITGGVSFTLSALCTTKLEAMRVSKVLGCPCLPYREAVIKALPGTAKLCFLGATLGQPIHAILHRKS